MKSFQTSISTDEYLRLRNLEKLCREMKKEELIQLMDQHLDWYPQYGIDGKEALAIAIISKLKELAVEKKM